MIGEAFSYGPNPQESGHLGSAAPRLSGMNWALVEPRIHLLRLVLSTELIPQ